MSEVKFSNGPWTIEKLEFGDGFNRLADSDGKTLMSNETYYPCVPESNHDWSLIAVAPEMYSELSKEVDFLIELLNKLIPGSAIADEVSGRIKTIEDVLIEARGEHDNN